MKIFFWQNCISPHQLPFIKELFKDNTRINKVYLITPIGTSNDRKLMGWNEITNVEGVEIILSPSKNEIEYLFQHNQGNAVHLFSGIRADKSVFEYFKESLNYNVKRGLITEPPLIFKKPLIFHKIRFLLFDYKYISKIDYVFGMGDNAVKYYKFWSKIWKVFLLGYCVENKSISLLNSKQKGLRMVYVGSLIKRKNVALLLKGISTLTLDADFTIDIIGDGPEFKKLLNYVDKHNLNTHTYFLGKLSMKEIHQKLAEYDMLILPSLHDGWGAVINEGLQSGLYIILSDNCGAKTLVEHSNRGIVFKSGNLNSLSDALNYCLNNVDKIKLGKQERVLWSEKISGSSFAKYMVDCLFEIDPVLPPWKRD